MFFNCYWIWWCLYFVNISWVRELRHYLTFLGDVLLNGQELKNVIFCILSLIWETIFSTAQSGSLSSVELFSFSFFLSLSFLFENKKWISRIEQVSHHHAHRQASTFLNLASIQIIQGWKSARERTFPLRSGRAFASPK